MKERPKCRVEKVIMFNGGMYLTPENAANKIAMDMVVRHYWRHYRPLRRGHPKVERLHARIETNRDRIARRLLPIMRKLLS